MRSLTSAIFAVIFFTGVASAQQFPRYVLKPGKTASDGNPSEALSSSALCTLTPKNHCYRLPPERSEDDTEYFYIDPRSKKVTAPSGEQLVLFSAHTMGGSGCAYRYALLRYSNDQLLNLLPRVVVSNMSDRALWSRPDISPLPIFLTAEALWEDGAHYSPHRYAIRGYRYNATTARYVEVFTYDTYRKYLAADLTGNDSVPVLNAERSRIDQHLLNLQSP